MDINVFVAIVAASSAIIGASVPSLISMYIHKKELDNQQIARKQEFENQMTQKKHEIKVKEYSNFLSEIQNFMNDPSIPKFYAYQHAINKILLFADNATAKCINDYFRKQLEATLKNGKALTRDDHAKYQTELINYMRQDINISTERIDEIRIVSYNPTSLN